METKDQRISERIKSLLLRRSSLTTLSLFAFLAIILLIWKVPQWQARGIADPKDRATIENAARGTFVQTIGGLFFFITAYFTSQNLKVTQQNLTLTQQTLVATQEKQVTKCFTTAIKQLGNTSIHVRLGAIYALERISQDSTKDYWQVMEILTAYVCEISPYPPRGEADNRLPSRMTTDIQAVLTVITRRAKSYGQGEENPLDLSKSYLFEANLRRANLGEAYFIEPNLSSSNLCKANLNKANLWSANLLEANLVEANLWGANLVEVNLWEANLVEANLGGANLMGANLMEANLVEANLVGTYLVLANLMGANLMGAKNLTPEQVKKAKNWDKAIYDERFSQQLGL